MIEILHRSVQPDLLERHPVSDPHWQPPPQSPLARDGDFLRRLGISEAIKAEMRRRYAFAVRQQRRESNERFLSRSRAFWEEIEFLNLLWVPEDPVYVRDSQGITLTTTNSLWQLLAPASGQSRILEHFLAGEATASAVLRFSVARQNAAGSGTAPTTQTPEKFNTRSPASASTSYGAPTAQVAWGTAQETLLNPLILPTFNAFGGNDRWVAQPGEEIYTVNGESVSGRSLSGTSIVSGHTIWEEL